MNGTGQIVARAGNGHALFLHGFEQRRLRLGRRAVDFVGQQQVGENRPAMEPEGAFAGDGILLQNVRAGDVRRHQVGRELDAAGVQVHRAAERSDHERLGQAGHADEQAMAAREQGDEHLVQHLALADDDLADFAQHLLVRAFEPGDDLFGSGGAGGRRSGAGSGGAAGAAGGAESAGGGTAAPSGAVRAIRLR